MSADVYRVSSPPAWDSLVRSQRRYTPEEIADYRRWSRSDYATARYWVRCAREHFAEGRIGLGVRSMLWAADSRGNARHWRDRALFAERAMGVRS